MALRELQIYLGRLQTPPRWLANILTAITSAPELSSIYFGLGSLSRATPEELERCASDYRWVLIDRWLACLAKGYGQHPALTVVLSMQNNGEPLRLGMFLPECRSVGVEVVVS